MEGWRDRFLSLGRFASLPATRVLFPNIRRPLTPVRLGGRGDGVRQFRAEALVLFPSVEEAGDS